MTRGHCWLASVAVSLSVALLTARADERIEAAKASEFGEFVGTSPCGDSIRTLLGIPMDSDSDLIQWKITLFRNQKTEEPAGYQLDCGYGPVVQGTNGLSKTKRTVRKEGKWTVAKGTKENPDATVYELNGALALLNVSSESKVLHVLNPDRSLMIGNGGWSYTINRADSAEKPGDRALALAQPEISYSISPAAKGPTVFGVFEGRTPCLGFARELKLPQNAGCIKAKWRVTLYQQPETLTPTT